MAERRLSIEQKKMQLSTAIPKLGAVGYAEWRPAMRAALVVQRAWAVVRDGVDEAEDEELLAKDETALALLMLNVEPLYRPTIDAARSAKDAWDTLHRMHLNQGETRQQQLRMQLATLVKAPNEAMLVYMNRAIAIKTELLALEADFNEADIVRQVLTGLHNDDRYTTTVKVITYSSELPDLTKLTEMLVEEERQLEPLATAGRRHGGDGIAFAAQTSTGRFTKPPKKCWICDKVGHIALHCPEATCFSCGQRGHMVRNCPKKQGARANAAVAF